MIRAVALALVATLAFAAPASRASAPRLELDARVVWSDPSPGFGGFSGIEVLDGGARFAAIGDRGVWATGRLLRDAGGRLTGAELEAIGPLHGIDGEALRGDVADAEGLAVGPDGAFHVSFEHLHRIRRYESLDAPAGRIPAHPAFDKLQNNSGLEALAIDGDGVIHAIAERSGRLDRPFPVYRFADGRWLETLSVPRSGAWLVTGADFGPDGRLYVLERDFGRFTGFASRIRRYDPGPDGFGAGETLLETRMVGSTDNFESISVWRDEQGDTRITLIADDNFFPLQSTAIAEYRLVAD